MKLYIGLMSGTSMDGIDAALVDVETHQLIAGITRPYSPSTLVQLQQLCNKQEGTLAFIAQLHRKIGIEFAAAVEDLMQASNVDKSVIKAIGSHGQTITHDTSAAIPYTIQLGCPHTIAELTKLKVVADFRTRDMVRKGQGAPFAPLYHQALFAKKSELIAVVNIGGISNITFLHNETVQGFDIGPGNCLLDAWINQCRNKPFDKDGQWASSGVVLPELLEAFKTDPYFNMDPPKSVGKEYFSLEWLKAFNITTYKEGDVQATLLALTVDSIIQTIRAYPITTNKLLLCGGGAHNQKLVASMRENFPELLIETTATYGVNPDYLEAMMFAWLADKTLNQEAVDLRSITGAETIGMLGAVY
ncbi:anhydro-N-acetylmuramic acid kinase (plasmid) [Legionella adelaidensis]|uniref:Anhydro-N-acetylmuramic acid kinase n=1 Tax=Legionella adelaidensis TaxID=45056 RepID=A0A0W0R521_9GAMM|nr:anhydro-N-acetylmuramic acid kinase [Legionella adelaidensis]KTC66155.1 anhydro-N-acetylmuramic acid kinase [Legionella adelaidensis]VEH85667.1 anhydro-N-acetylmuramic acid kinase [Legionella adelaidensis]